MTRPRGKKFFRLCGAVAAILFTVSLTDTGVFPPPRPVHNCRLWGVITSGTMADLAATVRPQLDSLKDLGGVNPDGWGIAYYIRSAAGVRIPVIRRGEPSAPVDPRYNQAVDELVALGEDGALAHVRKASGSLVTGVPDPHPFDRRAVNRDLRVLFGHNGSIATAVLLELINALDPNYLTRNPPDYNPNYLDSDLFGIYILENTDAYPESTVEACIRTAVVRIDSALGANPAYLNFVMTDGSVIWALHYTEEAASYPMYIYPDTGSSPTWIAASEPLDTHAAYWAAVPNSTLVTLQPGQLPRFTPVASPVVFIREKSGSDLTINYRSVNRRVAVITFTLSWPGYCKIVIYDETGRRVKNLIDGARAAGAYVVYWNGRDDRNSVLPSGNYFLTLAVDGFVTTKKIVFLK